MHAVLKGIVTLHMIQGTPVILELRIDEKDSKNQISTQLGQ